MDLTILQFECRQIPHCEATKLPHSRIGKETLSHRAKEAPVTVLGANPTGMIHVGGESPLRPFPSSTLVARNHVAEGVMLDPHVRAFLQLCDDRIADRILVERRRWLIEQSADNAQQFPALHGIRCWLIERC